jgi:hypothetical protein
METTLVQPNGVAPSQSRADGGTSTTSQLELSRKIAALTDLTAPLIRVAITSGFFVLFGDSPSAIWCLAAQKCPSQWPATAQPS